MGDVYFYGGLRLPFLVTRVGMLVWAAVSSYRRFVQGIPRPWNTAGVERGCVMTVLTIIEAMTIAAVACVERCAGAWDASADYPAERHLRGISRKPTNLVIADVASDCRQVAVWTESSRPPKDPSKIPTMLALISATTDDLQRFEPSRRDDADWLSLGSRLRGS